VQVKLRSPDIALPYLSTLEVCSRQGAVQIHVYLYLYLTVSIFDLSFCECVHSCSRCSFSTLRYDKLKEHLHKQHKVGSAPERRVRITDLVNLDLAKTVEGSVSQPACQPAEHQSAAVSDAPVLGRPASYVVDVDINIESTCPEKEQSVAESSVLLVEPADFLLGSVQPLPVMTAPGGGHVTLAPDAVNIAGAGSRFS